MSFTISVQNGTEYVMEGSDAASVPPAGTWNPAGLHGNAWLRSAELGTLNILDLGARHIPGDSGETWGVLISYQGEEMVGRYEGQGTLDVALNEYGQATPSGMDFREVDLPAFIQS